MTSPLQMLHASQNFRAASGAGRHACWLSGLGVLHQQVLVVSMGAAVGAFQLLC
jgi:hypothetical protein